MLVELAKSWPAPLRDRLELWLIATPESADLARAFSDRWTDGKPTLVLSLDAPGVGTMIRVGGRGPSAAFVADVAKSLWLPHETRPFVRSDRAAADWKVRGVPVVSLSGDHGDGPIDPALLAGVSQLVHESAMRWGKPPAAQPGPGASAARSSQNPG